MAELGAAAFDVGAVAAATPGKADTARLATTIVQIRRPQRVMSYLPLAPPVARANLQGGGVEHHRL
ncbi:MAG: hypothetical protein ACRDWB_07565, partial [Acidimicrobiales bacterium]